LVIIVNVAALVFALSISLPSDQVRLVEQLRALKRIPFGDYDAWAKEKAPDDVAERLQAGADKMLNTLEDEHFLIFNVAHLADAFGHPAHIGRLLMDQAVVTAGETARISATDLYLGMETCAAPFRCLCRRLTKL
jgi:hypothetical protein